MRLEKEAGWLRVVKRLQEDALVWTGSSQELLALITLVDVSTPEVPTGLDWHKSRKVSS